MIVQVGSHQQSLLEPDQNTQLSPRRTIHSQSMVESEIQPPQSPMIRKEQKEFNLDEIPPTINNVSQNLLRFTSYMGQMFEIKEQELELVKDTNFMVVRLETCQQAQLYNTVIAPFGQAVLQDTSNFFTEFHENYDDLDILKEFIGDVCNDALMIVQGFDICKKIHDPMLIAADVNKMKAKLV